MSYILDALTKSQQERRKGGVPTLSTPQLRIDPAKAHTRYASGALILVTGAAILVATQTLIRQHDGTNLPPQTAADAPTGAAPTAPVGAPSSEPSPALMTPATEAPPTPSLPAPPPVAETSSAASPPVPATHRAAQASAPRPTPSQPLRLTGGDDMAFTNAPIASPPRPAAPAEKPLESTASSAPAATPQPSATAPPPMSSEETALKSLEKRLFPGASEAMHPETARLADELLEMAARPIPRPAPSAVVPDEPALPEVIPLPTLPETAPTTPSSPHRETETGAASSTAVARAKVMPAAPRASAGGDVLPGVRALPNDVQASLGRLTINAHVYHDEPSGRMVIINMNRYREGESLREGPRVEAITVTGAVLSYQSHRFHLNVR